MTALFGPLMRWGLIAVAALGAIAAILLTVQHHDQGLVQQGRTDVIAAQSAQRAADAASVAARDQHTADTQREAANEADRFNTQAAASARGLDAFMLGMHQRADAASTTTAASAGAGAGGHGQVGPLPDPEVVCTGLCLRAADRAAELAKAVDCLRSAGAQCQADYEALSPEPAASEAQP